MFRRPRERQETVEAEATMEGLVGWREAPPLAEYGSNERQNPKTLSWVPEHV
jgi:hypothetical protein